MIESFLNKRYSLRNLDDSEFEKILPTLSKELELVDYSIHYSDKMLRKDWNNLLNFQSNTTDISSTTRVGMRLLEEFNQNIWLVSDKNGRSFSSCWTCNNLEKVIRWNRKMHSTPYISELRRGIYFCCKLGSKVTMYRPTLAKIICDYYRPQVVFDPCAGWGGRMLGSVAAGCNYIGVEPSLWTYNNLVNMAEYLGITNMVTLIHDTAENVVAPKSQLTITSPPYFDTEIYGTDLLQSVVRYPTYSEWTYNFLRKIIYNSVLHLDGISCWNVADYEYPLVEDVTRYHYELGLTMSKEFRIVSSKRPTAGRGKKSDVTYCFERKQ